jgi:hypothetical protein
MVRLKPVVLIFVFLSVSASGCHRPSLGAKIPNPMHPIQPGLDSGHLSEAFTPYHGENSPKGQEISGNIDGKARRATRNAG